MSTSNQLLRRLGAALTYPFKQTASMYNEAAKKRPALVGIATSTVKTTVADLFAQKVIEQREEIDWVRNGVFTSFGFGYLGIWQYYLYTNLFTRITPAIVSFMGQRAVGPALTFLDQAIHHPFVYFPAFYILKGSMSGEPPKQCLDKYRHDMWDNLKALWMVWVPSQLVNFSVVPLHLRVPFVAGVSFAWCIILSVLRGAVKPAETARDKMVQAVSDRMHTVTAYAQEDEDEDARHEHDMVYHRNAAPAPA